jgi:putative tricarboxylic transport membrane protein
MAGITPPVVTVSLGSRTVDIDTGELLFPGIVLAFCLFYFWDTRGLPDLSMLYAGPLLYLTAALAVVTLVQQAISIDGRRDRGESDRAVSDSGASAAAFDPDTAPESAAEDSVFTARNATALVVLTGLYIAALEPIGFLAATVAFLAITLYLFGERNPLVLAVFPTGFTFGIWLVFVQWLMVPL